MIDDILANPDHIKVMLIDACNKENVYKAVSKFGYNTSLFDVLTPLLPIPEVKELFGVSSVSYFDLFNRLDLDPGTFTWEVKEKLEKLHFNE